MMRAVLVSLLLAIPPALAQPTADADWKAGLAAYHAKDYGRACLLLRKAAEATATQGAIWADLGLCELRRGKKAESIRASNLAVRYGDEAIRKSAYFNLGLAGVNLAPQGVKSDGGCVPLALPKELGCAQRVTACGHTFQSGYTYQAVRSSGLLLLPCEDGCPAQSPLGGRCEGEYGENTSCREPDIMLASDEVLRGMSEVLEWSCERSEAVKARALTCQSKKGADAKRCAQRACQEAKRWREEAPEPRAEWKELQEELESWASMHECKSCGESKTETKCTVASIDPCSGRAGRVCTVRRSFHDSIAGTSKSSPPKSLVQEESFTVVPIPRPGAGR